MPTFELVEGKEYSMNKYQIEIVSGKLTGEHSETRVFFCAELMK